MRGMLVIAGAALLALALFGVLAMPDGNSSSGDATNTPRTTSTMTTDQTPVTTGTTPVDSQITPATGLPGETPKTGAPSEPTPTSSTGVPIVTVTPIGALPDVQAPRTVSLTEGLARVRDYYSEAHEVGNFTVRWRPGAFPAERAEVVAAMAAESHAYVVGQLGFPDDVEPIEIFLADQLFAQECWGCQGFAAADLRQVFILQDGSVAEDEFKALLTHEIGHVVSLHVGLPEKLFFAEGAAVWLMERDIVNSGYISAVQTSAWALDLGLLPSLDTLREATYQGRVRARLEYDPAGAFAMFMIEQYGLDAYKDLYQLESPEHVVDRTWDELEAEWHAWLAPKSQATVGEVTGVRWWATMNRVIDGFNRLYSDAESVSVEQYAQLTAARLEVNRLQLASADELMTLSGLTTITAQ